MVVAGSGVTSQHSSAAESSTKVGAAETPAETPVPEKPAGKRKRAFRGRLPNYYNRVVDEEQREKIYGIQKEYAVKIDALKAQLEALMAERDAKVADVLTPEQLEQVEKLRAEAKAKQKRGKTTKKSASSEPSNE
jgi:hypothetical protein